MSVITSKSKDLIQKTSLVGYLLLVLGSFLLIKNFFSFYTWLFVFFGSAAWNTIRRFSYAFWPMVFLTVLSLCVSALETNLNQVQVFALSLILLTYIYVCISFFNPIFYPVINWYQYDFRFRHDVPFFLCLINGCFESRLMDLKSGDGSFHSFEELELNQEIKMVYRFKDNQIILNASVLSIRQNTLGRGFYYGVKFDNSDSLDVLNSFWKAQKTYKKKLKKTNNEK